MPRYSKWCPTLSKLAMSPRRGPAEHHMTDVMQKLSLFSCGVTVFTSPIILFLDTSATPLGPKIGIAVTLVAFGVFTTGRPASDAIGYPAWTITPTCTTVMLRLHNGSSVCSMLYVCGTDDLSCACRAFALVHKPVCQATGF